MNQAQGQFMCSVEASKDLLQELHHEIQNFLGTNPDRVNWGDVGNAKHIEYTLDALLRFARG